jgi:hypothetical protein
MADDLKALLNRIESQNKQLESLINENKRLLESPFELTSLERLKVLTEETKSEFKELKETLKDANDELVKIDSTKYDKFFKSTKNILSDVKKLKKEIKDLRAAGDVDKAKELEKILADVTNKASSYYRMANREQEALNKRIVEGTHALDDFAEAAEQRTRAFRKGINEIASGSKEIYSGAKKIIEPWGKANHEAMNYARSMSMSAKTANAFLSKTVSWAAKNNIGVLFNKTNEELIKMQGKYSEVLGRNVQLTGEQKKNMLAIETFLGEDGMIDIANNLENFGLGMSDSAEFIHKQMSEAAKSGIAASKLTKTIRENIKMAQDYTFKNGLDGLASMAKKAIQLKTDMSLVNGFLEKTSTVEGAITTGANLQVLGGNYAVGANPLSMLYESLNDTEGMFDRAVNMTKGKVFYNNESGNFEMSGFDRYMMKHAATQMGIDPSKLIDVAFREASLNKIESEAKRSKIGNDEDMVELVKNLATWDKGSAWVNIDGKETKVSDLTHEDKAKLEAMQKTDSQNLQDMAINLRSITDVISGTEKEIANEQANAIKDVGQGVTNMLKTNTGILNTMSKIGAWINIISGGLNIGHGIFAVNSGILRVVMGMRNMAGMGNLFGGKGGKLGKLGKAGRYGGGLRGLRNSFKATKGNIITSTSGTQYKSLGGGKLLNMANGKTVTGAVTNNVVKSGSLTKLGTAAKFTRFGGGAAAGAISLGVDALTGDLKKDTEASIGRAVGATAGAVIGSFFGPVGTMVGGMIGTAITGAIQDAQKEKRAELRSKIAKEISQSMPGLSGLFEGDNALVGNYNQKQLKAIAKALEDNVIDENDDLNSWTLRKLRANNDLVRMQEQGVDVRIAMAKGGYLNGPKHSEGGMPILGSDISVEGGEFVVNKEATKKYKPLLEKINNNNLSITPNEPLGKQMKVNSSRHGLSSMPHNAKISFEPISLNMSGTIKVECGNKQMDITSDLMNNPLFINKLTEMISKQLNKIDNGAYNMSLSKPKFV